MIAEAELQPLSRLCSVTGKPLRSGEEYFSALVTEGDRIVRRDASVAAWQGPPEGALAWWRSRLPEAAGKASAAPQETLLDVLAGTADDAAQTAFRYLLTLLLIRRRMVKLVATQRDGGRDKLTVECPRRGERHEVWAVLPDPAEAAELEHRLQALLDDPSSNGAAA